MTEITKYQAHSRFNSLKTTVFGSPRIYFVVVVVVEPPPYVKVYYIGLEKS
jgi:hypothetical protein